MTKINPSVLAGALLTALVLASAPAVASTSTYEHDVVKYTNHKRKAADRVQVKSQSCVDRYAEKQGRWMAAHGSLKHQNLKTVLKKCKLSRVSENIAYGYRSGSKVVNAWMKSPGHKRNLMDPKVRLIGVGAVKDSDGVWWVSQVFGAK